MVLFIRKSATQGLFLVVGGVEGVSMVPSDGSQLAAFVADRSDAFSRGVLGDVGVGGQAVEPGVGPVDPSLRCIMVSQEKRRLSKTTSGLPAG